jgi:uncharacterized protein YoxC
MDLQLFLLIAIILIGLLVIFSLPLLLRLGKLINSISGLIDTTSATLKILTDNVSHTFERVNKILDTVDGLVNGVTELFSAIGVLGTSVKKLAVTITDSDSFINNVKTQLTGILTSIKVAVSALSKVLSNRGGKND